MTTNPRALEAAVAFWTRHSWIRPNIRERGNELVEKLTALAEKMPEIILKVQGTGLLCSAELNPETHQWWVLVKLKNSAEPWDWESSMERMPYVSRLTLASSEEIG